mgnify:CR=1 FL=1
MAVVGQRKNRAFKATAQMDERRINSLQKQLNMAKATKDKMNRKGNKEISNATRDERIKMLQGKIRKLRGVEKMDLKNNPLKINNKGLTPNSKVVKKKVVKKKVVAKKKKVVVKKKKVVAKKNNPRKANRAGQKYGQR